MSAAVGLVTARLAITIRYLRKEAGLSAQAVADGTASLHTKVSRMTLANLESGRLAALSVDQLDAIATALGVQVVDLLTGDAVATAARQRADALRDEADRIEQDARKAAGL